MSRPALTDWHRQIAEGVAAAHPLTPAVPVQAKSNHLLADNDEPEAGEAPLFSDEEAQRIDSAMLADKQRNRYDSRREEAAMHQQMNRELARSQGRL